MNNWTITDARRFAPEAFKDALAKYPDDVESALVFFGSALLGHENATDADIARARAALDSTP